MNKHFGWQFLGAILGIAVAVVVAVINGVVKDWGDWDTLLGAFLGIAAAVVLFSGLWVIFILGVKLVSSVGKWAGRKERAEKTAKKKEEWWEL